MGGGGRPRGGARYVRLPCWARGIPGRPLLLALDVRSEDGSQVLDDGLQEFFDRREVLLELDFVAFTDRGTRFEVLVGLRKP